MGEQLVLFLVFSFASLWAYRLYSKTTVGRLDDEFAIITGGSGGLGSAVAQLLVQNHVRVVVLDKRTSLENEKCMTWSKGC
jgi:NADPH:quinone reductase-like Zn-dependent oxidoreductase